MANGHDTWNVRGLYGAGPYFHDNARFICGSITTTTRISVLWIFLMASFHWLCYINIFKTENNNVLNNLSVAFERLRKTCGNLEEPESKWCIIQAMRQPADLMLYIRHVRSWSETTTGSQTLQAGPSRDRSVNTKFRASRFFRAHCPNPMTRFPGMAPR
jgi:hypothetical protein